MFSIKRNSSSLLSTPNSARIAEKWINSGVTAVYILDQARWKINRVTGLPGNGGTQTNPPIYNGFLGTDGSKYTTLSLNGLTTTKDFSIVIAFQRYSASGVPWSILGSNWTGMYASSGSTIRLCQTNAFNGLLSTVANSSDNVAVAASKNYSDSLKGFSRQSGFVYDTSVPWNGDATSSSITLGCSRTGIDTGNYCIAGFKLIFAFQSYLSDADMWELGTSPQNIFEPARIWIPQAGITGAPTLSFSTYAPDSITSSSMRARVAFSR